MRIVALLKSVFHAFLMALPDEFSRWRIKYYNANGCRIDKYCSISPNVRIRGKFKMGRGSSLAQNCSVSGEDVGVFIGENVMIAPNVVIVAFNHGFAEKNKPMIDQANVCAPVYIENNVWIGSNCTIGMGVTIGEGSIVASNTFVNKNVEPFSIVGGLPAKLIKIRDLCSKI